jgi:hypothetical protein
MPTTLGIEYIYLDLLLIYDMSSNCAVFAKLSELKCSVVMIRQDCQKIPLNILIALLN